MTLSVVVPVYDGADHLGACLQSILSSTRLPQELLVVDDGSQDESRSLAQSFAPVRLLTQHHRGASAARNLGVEAASGELIAFLDGDDLMTPQRLGQQAAFLTAHPQVDGVFGEVLQFSDPEGAFPCDTRQQPAMLIGALTIRRSVFDRVGGFDEQYRAGEFMDWVLRAQEVGVRFESLAELVLRRRIHARNGGRVRPEARQDIARVLMAAHKRRQAQSTPK